MVGYTCIAVYKRFEATRTAQFARCRDLVYTLPGNSAVSNGKILTKGDMFKTKSRAMNNF